VGATKRALQTLSPSSSTTGWRPSAGGGQPETDGEEGLRDLAAAFGMIESSQLGRTVSMEELLSGEVSGYQREIDDHFGLG